jgi:uncharacterized protein YabN with tetrapyrrole methylase and pyrophosphatase domain
MLKNHQAPMNLFDEASRQEAESLKFGFYWENLEQIIDQVKDECREIMEAYQNNDKTHLEEEIGDLILAALSVSIFCKVDQQQALEKSIKKYQARFDALINFVRNDGLENLKNQPMEILMQYWKKAKLNSSS